jgi:hypothetical protein
MTIWIYIRKDLVRDLMLNKREGKSKQEKQIDFQESLNFKRYQG